MDQGFEHRWKSIAGWTYGTCGLDTDGQAWCWGRGRLGDGTNDEATTPVAVAGGHTFTQLAVGERFDCGTTEAGELWCWGTLPGFSEQVTTPYLITTPVPVKSPG